MIAHMATPAKEAHHTTTQETHLNPDDNETCSSSVCSANSNESLQFMLAALENAQLQEMVTPDKEPTPLEDTRPFGLRSRYTHHSTSEASTQDTQTKPTVLRNIHPKDIMSQLQLLSSEELNEAISDNHPLVLFVMEES